MIECPLCGKQVTAKGEKLAFDDDGAILEHFARMHKTLIMTNPAAGPRYKAVCACGDSFSPVGLVAHFKALAPEDFRRHRMIYELTAGS